ncbi:MAG: bifunctional nuclease family protein [Thermodesulfobacteriota bacterium]
MQKEMVVAGVTVDPMTKSPIVILRDRESRLALPIWIGMVEANAIIVVIEGVEIARPLTHDLLKSILERTGTSLRRIEITEIRDNTYYALLHLEREGVVFTVDSRPSDAIALALRCGVPIMVAEEVLRNALPIENLDGAPEGKDKLTELLEKMDPEQFSKYKM